MNWKLWCINGHGLWLPDTVTASDMAAAQESREHWERLNRYGRLRWGQLWDILHAN